MPVAFVTGASRGLGAELVRQLLLAGYVVCAGRRSEPSQAEIEGLPPQAKTHLLTVPLDVDDEEQILRLPDRLNGRVNSLDLLVNNAGISAPPASLGGRRSVEQFGELRSDALLSLFRTNAVAPVLVAQQLRPLMARSRSPVIVNLTSVHAALTARNAGGHYGYRSSKCALNMMTRTLAADLRDEGIVVVGIHPGWVRTDMGGGGGEASVEEAAQGVLTVVNRLAARSSGLIFDWQGRRLRW